MIFLLFSLALSLSTISASRTRQETCIQSFNGVYTLDVFETTSPLVTGEGDRFEAIRIDFGISFCNPPKVLVTVHGFNFDKSQNPYFDISAENIDIDGFTLVVHGRSDTILYGVNVEYIADDILPKVVA